MKDGNGYFTRRDWLAVSGLAAGALSATRAQAAPQAPSAAVSIAKVRSYDEDLVAQFKTMFDQIGGIGRQVQGKTSQTYCIGPFLRKPRISAFSALI